MSDRPGVSRSIDGCRDPQPWPVNGGFAGFDSGVRGQCGGLERAERGAALADRIPGSLSTGRGEVVPSGDRCHPSLEALQVCLGFLDLGIRGSPSHSFLGDLVEEGRNPFQHLPVLDIPVGALFGPRVETVENDSLSG